MSRHLFSAFSALALCTIMSAPVAAAAPEGATPKVTATRAFRASTLTGMKVYNTAGDEVGTVNELVINVEKGKVEYVALSVGGFLGIGDKLFAVPWRLMSLKFDEDKTYFVVDVSKETLQRAEGFDQDHWPNVADPNWADSIERHYGLNGSTHEGTFEKIDGSTLVMKDATGQATHMHRLASNLTVMRGEARSNTADLRAGDRIRVTLGEHEGNSVVTKIEVLAK